MSIKEKILLKVRPEAIIEKSMFFDKDWYVQEYNIDTDPAKHYLNEGWKLGYDPSMKFSTNDYLINNQDIVNINPLLHYEAFGKNEGRRPFMPKRKGGGNYELEDVDLEYEAYDKIIRDKPIVSFDIFDTLVIRPFVKAEDLFVFLEKEFSAEGFKEARIKAETEARKKLNKEVNIDEIYSFIEEKYQDLKEKEIQCEISFCHINPLIRPVYEKAKELGKRVIAISDMYLGKDIVDQILGSCLYDMDDVYVSCDLNKTKGSGELYKKVIELEGCQADEIVHFGDNYISDYSEAIYNGLSAFQTPKLLDKVLNEKNNAYLSSVLSHSDDLAVSLYLETVVEYLAENDDSFYKRLAYIFGGPLALSYLAFVCRKTEELNIDKLFFVSRDGYILKELYEKYFYQRYRIESEYAYLSRAAVFSGFVENGLCEDKEKILEIAKCFIPGLKDYDNDKELIDEWSKRQSHNLEKHLEKIAGSAKKIATVDMFSGNYSSQKGAKYYLKDRLLSGFYAGNFVPSVIEHETYCERLLGMRDNLAVKLSEILISSYENPVMGVDENGKPVYETQESELRIGRYKEISEGIEKYFDNFFSNFEISEDYLLKVEEWIDICDAYFNKCTDEELEKLSEIIDSENPVRKEDEPDFSELIRQYRERGY